MGTTMISADERYEIAELVADALDATGEVSARIWEGAEYGHLRVYVSRTLSRGRRQDMGYIEVMADGSVNAGPMTRRAGWAADIATSAVAH